MPAISTLAAGSNYTLKLTPKETLTACQIKNAIQLLNQKRAEIKQRFGIDITRIQIQPRGITMDLHAGIMIQVDPFLYFLVTVFGILGIAIIGYEIVVAIAAIPPLAWLFGIFGLAFAAYVIYKWEGRKRRP